MLNSTFFLSSILFQKISNSPTHRFYLNSLKPIWKFQFSLLAFFKNFGFLSPQSSALEIPRPSFGWV